MRLGQCSNTMHSTTHQPIKNVLVKCTFPATNDVGKSRFWQEIGYVECFILPCWSNDICSCNRKSQVCRVTLDSLPPINYKWLFGTLVVTVDSPGYISFNIGPRLSVDLCIVDDLPSADGSDVISLKLHALDCSYI